MTDSQKRFLVKFGAAASIGVLFGEVTKIIVSSANAKPFKQLGIGCGTLVLACLTAEKTFGKIDQLMPDMEEETVTTNLCDPTTE